MRQKDRCLFAAGLAAVLLLAVPGLLLGENAVIAYHDQLDGEMIAYILQAKHLWEGDRLPEFMNGALKTALTLPAPGCVLLFLGGNALGAFWVMQIAGSLVGYLGMYLLAKDVTGRAFPSVCAAGLYACIPFLPVYGLAQYGLPMLLWCAMSLARGRRVGLSYAYTVLYALTSSPVLVGFAVLLALAAGIAMAGRRGKPNGEAAHGRHEKPNGEAARGRRHLIGMWVTLAVCYAAVNASLLAQILGVGEFVTSHKAEYVLTPQSFLSGWLTGFWYGGQHSADYHLGIAIATAVVLAVWAWRTDRDRTGRPVRAILYGLGGNLAISGVSALWNSAPCVALRSVLGALGAFQLDRLLWLSPCLWYLILACDAALAWEICASGPKKTGVAAIVRGIPVLAVAAAVACGGVQIIKNGDAKSNLQKLRHADYPAMSYADYYAIGVMEQVEECIRESSGEEQSEYRVVSLGIDPAAALYHGFYCLDGYSNNYDLEYKHMFRKAIAPALEVSDYLREYYDNWGNRCYLFGSECPGYYTIEKGGFYFTHLELNTEALGEMGADYLLSAAYVANAEELGLELLSEEPFCTEESYYRIFVYEVPRP